MKTAMIISLFIFACFISSTVIATTYYVDKNAPGSNNGTDWDNAYNELYDALAVAIAGDEIRVAEGTYKPDTSGLVDPREATFQLISGVEIYGGYAGYGEPYPDERVVKAHETIVSGDIGTEGYGGDNSYHVVTGTWTDVDVGEAEKYYRVREE